MGVPFEALLPYGIMASRRMSYYPSSFDPMETAPRHAIRAIGLTRPIQMFMISGAGLSKLRHMQNGGKRARHSVDQWDRQMMDRDRRLTGFLRGQTDQVLAPEGFELSNGWRVEKRIM
ncbi:hypothetical protein B0A51_14088 [Rachicladosporium sp. CCFEE 5018]|nr:hypothetical protein B0A51_14148 [Rachicladosporium sp. CCFEE 5018]OQO18828.1 hypothetical protein B0A51_14088 [Rachicladosporium sp. CCFEE 5018]OQO19126.1 hypothetical protein B0A51_13679 [Rachicladosporium sp. CCFEE 5018]OQO19227.1 hypothetical protein B0A51_13474 [Rachicladosporium sp. CCFEE 5018]